MITISENKNAYALKLFNIGAQMIRKYIRFIYEYIKEHKAESRILEQADVSCEVYDTLFFESLNEVFGCNGKTTYCDRSLIKEVSKEIKRILQEDGVYTYCQLHRRDFITICFKTFRKVVETACEQGDFYKTGGMNNV